MVGAVRVRSGVAVTSIAIGADGLGFISFLSETNWDLMVAHCDDVACTNGTVTDLKRDDNAGVFSSVAFGADGLALIAYQEGFHGVLETAHCQNSLCTAADIKVLPTEWTASNIGQHTSIAFGVDGRALVAFHEHNPSYDLRIAHLPIDQ